MPALSEASGRACVCLCVGLAVLHTAAAALSLLRLSKRWPSKPCASDHSLWQWYPGADGSHVQLLKLDIPFLPSKPSLTPIIIPAPPLAVQLKAKDP